MQHEELTENYSTKDWDRLSESWELMTYLTYPDTEEPVEMSSLTISLLSVE